MAVGTVAESWELAPEQTAPWTARRAVRAALSEWVEEDVVETAVLLTSEVVTNAVVHARSTAVLTVALTPGAVLVSVSDVSRYAPVAQQAAPEWESGRGLGIVDTLASAWGVHHHPEGGKTVWFQLDRRPGVDGSGCAAGTVPS